MLKDATVEEVAGLTAIISGAALDARLWDDFVEELWRVSGGVAAHILAYDACGLETGFIAKGYDPASLQTYAEHYHHLNVWAPGFLKFGVGEVVSSRAMASEETLFASEFYHDWVRPNDDIWLGGGTTIAQSQAGTFLLGGNIPARFGDEAADKWLRLVQILVPHLCNAWDTAKALTTARIAGHDASVIITDPSGRVMFLDDGLKHLSGKTPEVSISIRGQVRFRQASISDAFMALCATRLMRDHPGGSRVFETGDHRISIAALNPDIVEATWPTALVGSPGPCLAIVLTRSEKKEDLAARLSRVFGLSVSEAQVAAALAMGSTPAEMADARGVSIHTIRNQIKSAMWKCGVSRQSQLVSLVLSQQ